ncbi:carboxymuconolactone decarboxylase family protein [uncultured Maribacter sp.]|uniref:carboxymuconolactone decarboxylase family protein n=1 Tax=uncultured Maribacter sp. TaxID=431308 RepID=UPI0026303639|nr:carboxymuconolactone decarboxylase family protein [uncultured Maribacter sp.]
MERITYQDIPDGMFQKLKNIEDFINQSPLNESLLKLIKLRVSQINGCAYCVDMHYKELKHINETELRLSSLVVWKETPYFSEKERAVLNFSETLTQIDNTPINNEIYKTLEEYFSKSEICYITLAITQINTWNRLMKTFLFTPGNYKVSM